MDLIPFTVLEEKTFYIFASTSWEMLFYVVRNLDESFREMVKWKEEDASLICHQKSGPKSLVGFVERIAKGL